MFTLVRRYDIPVMDGTTAYRAAAYAEQQPDGMWHGQFVFTPILGSRPVITARETTQSTKEALAYWAGGITPVYLEGALQRALALQPEAQLERRLADIVRLETDALEEVAELERAAALARDVAARTEQERKAVVRELANIRGLS